MGSFEVCTSETQESGPSHHYDLGYIRIGPNVGAINEYGEEVKARFRI